MDEGVCRYCGEDITKDGGVWKVETLMERGREVCADNHKPPFAHQPDMVVPSNG